MESDSADIPLDSADDVAPGAVADVLLDSVADMPLGPLDDELLDSVVDMPLESVDVALPWVSPANAPDEANASATASARG